MSRTFFHSCPAEAEPAELLDPDRQFTDPWGGREHGSCDKCAGRGAALYECRSCLEIGPRSDCPACQGRVRFEATCPACGGDGEISRTRRHGIAVFPAREGLYRYLAEKDAEAEQKLVVEVEGKVSEDRDLDADAGALLVCPERIVGAEPLDADLIRQMRERLGLAPSGQG